MKKPESSVLAITLFGVLVVAHFLLSRLLVARDPLEQVVRHHNLVTIAMLVGLFAVRFALILVMPSWLLLALAKRFLPRRENAPFPGGSVRK